MKTVILNAGQALRLHEVGGYASLRADEPIAAFVEFGSELPPWITFISPASKIWGARFRISDLHGAREGAVLRDAEMQRRIKSLFPPPAIYSLAPLPVVGACASDTSESVHAELQGYYHLSAVIAQDVKQAKDVIKRAEAWLREFPREAISNMDDAALESAGWLSPRAESQRPYGRLLFAAPAVAQGMRGAAIDQIVDDLKRALQIGVSLDSLQLDPRFLRVPKFSLGLMSMEMASQGVPPQVIQIAELRAQLVENLDSPLLFDDVAAERRRLDDEYKDLLVSKQDAGARIRASLDRYVSRWAMPLAKAVIID
jgi:hypothetical protein